MEATKSALNSTGKAMKNMGETIKYKITGQKYHDSLMGEGLTDVLRKATAKTLEAPDTECNQQASSSQAWLLLLSINTRALRHRLLS